MTTIGSADFNLSIRAARENIEIRDPNLKHTDVTRISRTRVNYVQLAFEIHPASSLGVTELAPSECEISQRTVKRNIQRTTFTVVGHNRNVTNNGARSSNIITLHL